MARCACEVFGPHLQRPLHQLHEGLARAVQEQQERAACYIAALMQRRRTLDRQGGPDRQPVMLPPITGVAALIAESASQRIRDASEVRGTGSDTHG